MKKALSVLLSLALVFTFYIPPASASEVPETPTEETTFHADTIRQMIEANLEFRNTDEQFYHMLANAYLADPALLVETITDLSNDDITYLAKAISYDLQKTGRANEAVIPADCNTPVASAIAKLIHSQASNTANISLEALFDVQPQDMVAPAAIGDSSIVPYVSQPILSVSQADIYTAVSATFSIYRYATSTTSTRYNYTIYRTDGVTDTVVGFGGVVIPANSVGADVTFHFVNNMLGTYQIYVKVSHADSPASSLSNQVSVTGTWHITVALTSDRTQLGTITLFNGEGTQVSSSICLGRSDGNLPMNQTNGHTPIGIYTGILYQANSNTYSYGPYRRIYLNAVSGYVADECSHRSGLLIHGGDPSTNTSSPSYPLRPTNGCIRVTNDYQLSLVTQIDTLIANYHYSVGRVTVTQDGLIDL